MQRNMTPRPHRANGAVLPPRAALPAREAAISDRDLSPSTPRTTSRTGKSAEALLHHIPLSATDHHTSASLPLAVHLTDLAGTAHGKDRRLKHAVRRQADAAR